MVHDPSALMRIVRVGVAGAAVLASPTVLPAPAAHAAPPPTAAVAPGAGLGTIEAVAVSGRAMLATSSRIVATVPVQVPRTSRVSVRLTLGRTTCSAARTVPRGRTRVSVACSTTPGASSVPALVAVVTATVARTDRGVTRRLSRTWRPSITLDDGAALSTRAARARWTAIGARLRARAAALQVGGQAGVATGLQPGSGVGLEAGAMGPGRGALVALPQFAAGSVFTPTAADAASRLWRQAQTSGWHSELTAARLQELLRLSTASGGYGLGREWDAFGDGTLNPVSTTYTVTTAGHVGWVLLEARRNGADAGALDRAIDALLAVPRLNGGRCLAYSDSAFDAVQPCVFNVSHGAAAFLVQARELSTHRAAEVDAVLAGLRRGLVLGYDRASGYWSYKAGDRAAQDISHQIYTARSVDVVSPGFGAVARMMARPWWRQPAGLTQPPIAVASAMVDVARDCDRARSPAVLLGVERGIAGPAQAFTLIGMSGFVDDITTRCLA